MEERGGVMFPGGEGGAGWDKDGGIEKMTGGADGATGETGFGKLGLFGGVGLTTGKFGGGTPTENFGSSIKREQIKQ